MNERDWRAQLALAFNTPGTLHSQCLIGTDVFRWDLFSCAEWNAQRAFANLNVPLIPFPDVLIGASGGFTCKDGIALNPMTRTKLRTAAHELAHWLLRHAAEPMIRSEADDLEGIHEVEAEGAAFVVCYALGMDSDVEHSRAYLQHFTAKVKSQTVDSWDAVVDRIIVTARRILMAGWTQRAPDRPKTVGDVLDFRKRIRIEG